MGLVMESVANWLDNYCSNSHRELVGEKNHSEELRGDYEKGLITVAALWDAGAREEQRALVLEQTRRIGWAVRVVAGRRIPRLAQVLRAVWGFTHAWNRNLEARIHRKHGGLFAQIEERPSWDVLRFISEQRGWGQWARLIDDTALDAATDRYDLQHQQQDIISKLRLVGLTWRF